MLDKRGYIHAILMDLPKAFGAINHELLVVKLNARVFKLIFSKELSSWKQLLCAPQVMAFRAGGLFW